MRTKEHVNIVAAKKLAKELSNNYITYLNAKRNHENVTEELTTKIREELIGTSIEKYIDEILS